MYACCSVVLTLIKSTRSRNGPSIAFRSTSLWRRQQARMGKDRDGKEIRCAPCGVTRIFFFSDGCDGCMVG